MKFNLPDPPESPSATYARISREQFADEQARFLPLQKMANDLVLNPEKRNQILEHGRNQATEEVDHAFGRAENRLETLGSRSNQMRSARQIEASDASNALHKTAATVSARNRTTQYFDEKQAELLAG